eukprot:jgi/Picsp_1/1901/NSC_05367-R1_---NA---
MSENLASLPPKVSGLPQGWLRLCISLDHSGKALFRDGQTGDDRALLGVLWWGDDANNRVHVPVSDEGVAVVPFAVRTSFDRLRDYFRDAEDGCLQLFLMSEVSDRCRTLGKCVLSLRDLFQAEDSQPDSQVLKRCIDVNVNDVRRDVSDQLVASGTCDIEIAFSHGALPMHSKASEHARSASMSDTGHSLDSSLSDPSVEMCSSWYSDISNLRIEVLSVTFESRYAPLNVSQPNVYVTVGMLKDRSDQQTTRPVPCTKAADGMRAKWTGPDTNSCPFIFETRAMCDCGKSSGAQGAGACMESPILRAGLWKSGPVTQFHDFSKMAEKVGVSSISPFDELIGSAVVVPAGALAQKDGVELPLYNSELEKTGKIHLRIVPGNPVTPEQGDASSALKEGEQISGSHGENEATKVVVVDEKSALEYEILSSMKTLALHTIPRKEDIVSQVGLVGEQKFAWSGSDSEDATMVGVEYEGAVSCSDDEAIFNRQEIVTSSKPKSQLSDEWIFGIEKKHPGVEVAEEEREKERSGTSRLLPSAVK